MIADSEARAAAAAFGVSAFPFSVFVWADGTVAARATGAIPFENMTVYAEALAEGPG